MEIKKGREEREDKPGKRNNEILYYKIGMFIVPLHNFI